MSKQVKTMEQLKDSRILYEKELPAFGYMIVLIIAFLLIMVLIWSTVTPKAYMITADGTVTNDDSSYVMSSYTGQIDEFYISEGQLVEEGDVLFTVKSTDYDLQQQQLAENRKTYEEKVTQYEKLVQSIKDDTNYFDAANPEDELYYSTYETYKAQVQQNELDASQYEAYGYTDEQIEAELVKNQSKISEIYYTAIKSAENSMLELETQIEAIDAQLLAVSSGQDTYAVTASTSGTVHLLANYRSGMVVQTASSVATITPENSDYIVEAYVGTSDMARMHEGDHVEIAVSGLTQSVYGTITGTVTQIDSNVTTSQSDDGTNSSYFKIQITPDSLYLTSKSGDKVDISNGMSVEARIEYDKVTYFNYVLEKLGFSVR